jgi:ubiquinone/menaquinone biosynthesis C-methylase UbiE
MGERTFYVHGTEPEEQQRLTALNDMMNQASVDALGPRPGERVLDVGAGLGQLTRAIARRTGTAVVGVERSAEQIAEAIRQARAAGEEHHLDFRAGDAVNLPLEDPEWATFDVAHTRFLLEHVPDPLEVVRSMVRAVRPGGRIVIEDDDHDLLRLWPEPPGVMPIWNAYMRSYDRAGNDPIVGRRLVELLHRAGAEPKRNTWLFFGSCSGGPNFSGFVNNLSSILVGARASIMATGFSEDAIHRAVEELSAWEQRKDAAFWYAIAWAEGIRPTP